MAKFSWLKYDLHMHSFFSKSKDGARVKEMTAVEFVDSISDRVDVFSVTDHNHFEAKFYNEISEYIKDKNIKIIDGAELDVYVSDSDYFQMGVYFEPNTIRENIQIAIADLYTGGLKPRLSEIISKLLSLGCKFILLPEGNKSRGITQIINRLDKSAYNEITRYAMYKVFGAYDMKENFDSSGQNIWAKNYFESSEKFNQFVESKTEEKKLELSKLIHSKIKDNSVSLSAEVEEIFIHIIKYGRYFAYFTFSDWHNAEEYKPTLQNFIFGSRNTYFESFEIAVLDPASRIIRTSENEIPISESILESMSFEINGKPQEVKLSPGLNVIIGKRGSGKSLLVAAMKKLSRKEDKTLSDYEKKYKITNIQGLNYGGIPVQPGELGTIAVLEQDNISKIYSDPDKAWETISTKFPKIAEFDKKELNRILALSSEIIPLDKNFKSVTSNLKQIRKLNSYMFKYHDWPLSSNYETNFASAIENLQKVQKEVSKFGIQTLEFQNIINRISRLQARIEKLVTLYSQIVSLYNDGVKEINSFQSDVARVNRLNRTEIDGLFQVINNNFKKLLIYKKLHHLLFKFKKPKPIIEKNREGKYIFVASYKVPDDLSERIIETLVSTLKKMKNRDGLELVFSYLCGDTTILASKNHFSDDYIKFLKSDIFDPKKDFFQIVRSDFDISTIKTITDLESSEKDGHITNLNDASLGTKSVAYLDMIFESHESIMLFDQPEDNIDNDYICNYLVPLIKAKKREKQLIFVTHNPSVAVYGDAFNYIFALNDHGLISYVNRIIESKKDKDEIMKILDGGQPSFANRNQKYGNILGEEKNGNTN